MLSMKNMFFDSFNWVQDQAVCKMQENYFFSLTENSTRKFHHWVHYT